MSAAATHEANRSHRMCCATGRQGGVLTGPVMGGILYPLVLDSVRAA